MEQTNLSSFQSKGKWPETWVAQYGPSSEPPFAVLASEINKNNPHNNLWLDQGKLEPKPFSAWNKTLSIVFDGYLYNQATLARELVQIQEDSLNPAQTVLLAYQKWKSGAFSRLKGCFSLVIWDSETDQLLAVRDPIGVYPLFYTQTTQGLFLSTSIDALQHQPAVSNNIDRAVVADFLAFQWPFKNETFFECIFRVLPGHFLLSKNGSEVEQERYWKLDNPDGTVEWQKGNIPEQFEALLIQAANNFLDRGPSAIYLSGGLDSVTVAAFLSDQSKRKNLIPPMGLSLVFPGDIANEEPVQRGVANNLKLPHYITSLAEASGSRGLFQAALNMSKEWPAPMFNLWRPAYHHLGNIGIQNGYSTIMTGSGGDEWLGLSPYYSADLMRSFDFLGLVNLVKGIQQSFGNPSRVTLTNLFWRFGLRPLLGGFVAEGIYKISPQTIHRRRQRSLVSSLPPWIAPDPELKTVLYKRAEKRADESLQKIKPKSYYLSEIRSALDHSLVSLELEEEFESGRRLGAPVLGFFQHQDLVEFLFHVSPKDLNNGEPSKGLVRGILNQRFPELGFKKQKKVSGTTTFQTIIQREGQIAWNNMGGAQSLIGMGIIDPDGISGVNENDVTHPGSADAFRKWQILNFEIWVRHHGNINLNSS